MGSRGPAPKPTVLRLVEGNPGKRALNADEPIPPDGEFEIPPVVSSDPDALKEWNRIVPVLSTIRLAKPIDVAAIVQWCVTWSRWLKVATFVREKGTTYPIKNRRGIVVAVKEFPQAAEFRKLQGGLILLARELGMTPAARARLRSEGGGDAKRADQNELRRKFFGAGGA